MTLYELIVNNEPPILFDEKMEAERFLMCVGYERFHDPFGREFWSRKHELAFLAKAKQTTEGR